jgi:hypothetical protein
MLRIPKSTPWQTLIVAHIAPSKAVGSILVEDIRVSCNCANLMTRGGCRGTENDRIRK